MRSRAWKIGFIGAAAAGLATVVILMGRPANPRPAPSGENVAAARVPTAELAEPPVPPPPPAVEPLPVRAPVAPRANREQSRTAPRVSTGIAGTLRDAGTGEPLTRFEIGFLTHLAEAPHIVDHGKRLFETNDGTFSILDLKAGEHVFDFKAEGYLAAEFKAVRLTEGEVRRDFDMRLAKAGVIRGVVLEAGTGNPVEEARVVPRDAKWKNPVMAGSAGSGVPSGPNGRYELRGLEPGTVRLHVSHPEFADWESEPIEVRAGIVVEPITAIVSRGGAVEGFVLDDVGEPVDQATVAAPKGPLRWMRFHTDKKGYFRIVGLRPGPTAIEASFSREAGACSFRWRQRTTASPEEGRVTRVEFPRLPIGKCMVRGWVMRGGEPVQKARVLLRPGGLASERSDPHSLSWEFRCQTGEDGSFAIEDVPPGDAGLDLSYSTSDDQARSKEYRLSIPESGEIRFDALLPIGEIEGRVVRGSDGSPVAGVTVGALPVGERGPVDRPISKTNAEGRYRLQDLESGDYVVRVETRTGLRGRGPDLAGSVQGPVRVGEGAITRVDFSLVASASASVLVLDSSGAEVSEATVLLRAAGWKRESADPFGVRARFDSEKRRFRVEGLAPGLWYAVSFQAGLAPAISEERPVRAGEEAEFRIRLQEGTSVRVRVLDEAGAALDVPAVRVLDERGREILFSYHWSERDEPEAPSLSLVPGNYTLEVSMRGYAEARLPVRVGSVSPQDVVVRLRREDSPR